MSSTSSSSETPQTDTPSFSNLGLLPEIQQALSELGYETPSPVQAKTIPTLLAGKDVIGQAQTGTGKTAAFALPMLQALEVKRNVIQGLVLAPTRELALQVAEAIRRYAKHLGKVNVLPIFGGDSMTGQLKRLQQGVHIVVGTPGRVIDHLRRKTLALDKVKYLVLDEADEMLRMGFLEEVEHILEQVPAERQTALFSATMPPEIAKVAARYMKDAENIALASQTKTVATIEQRCLLIPQHDKVDALVRILESEDADATLVFSRTRASTAQLAEQIEARGIAAEAMHGDMAQTARQSVIRRLKNGQLKVVVATDVAARGLDVDTISHVINVDIPNDAETYVHRIGRTGRAGRKGVSILFVAPRERRMLRDIERFTKQPIVTMNLPTLADVEARRLRRMQEKLVSIAAVHDLSPYEQFVSGIVEAGVLTLPQVAATLARMAFGDKPLLSEDDKQAQQETPRKKRGETVILPPRGQEAEFQEDSGSSKRGRPAPSGYRMVSLGVGKRNNVRPKDVVGAIANETGIPGKAIGSIDLYETFSTVVLSEEHAARVVETMQNTLVCGRYVKPRILTEPPREEESRGRDDWEEERPSRRRQEGSWSEERPSRERSARAPREDRPSRSRDDERPSRIRSERSDGRPARRSRDDERAPTRSSRSEERPSRSRNDESAPREHTTPQTPWYLADDDMEEAPAVYGKKTRPKERKEEQAAPPRSRSRETTSARRTQNEAPRSTSRAKTSSSSDRKPRNKA